MEVPECSCCYGVPMGSWPAEGAYVRDGLVTYLPTYLSVLSVVSEI